MVRPQEPASSRGEARERQEALRQAQRRVFSEPVTLCELRRFEGHEATWESEQIPCEGYTHFALYLFMRSIGTPTTIQFTPRFGGGGKYPQPHSNLQGIWASMVFEDTVMTGAGIYEVYSGELLGSLFSLLVDPLGDTGPATAFVLTARIVFIDRRG